MEFLRGILKSVSFHIGKLIVYVLIALLLTFALRSRNVNALTINDSYDYVADNYLKVLINTFETSDYKYYFIASNYDSSVSYNRNNYYLCLTNNINDDNINVLNANVNCDEIFLYNYNNGYILSKISDTSLSINNSIYYTNCYDINNSISYVGYFIIISLGIWFLSFYYIFSSLKSTGRGFKYDDI